MERGQTLRGAAAISAVAGGTLFTAFFLARFRPALHLVAETAWSSAAAILLILACVAAGEAALIVAGRIVGVQGRHDRPLSELLLIGFAVLGTVVAVIATAGIAAMAVIRLLVIAAAAGGAVVAWRRRTSFGSPPLTPAGLLLSIPVVIAAVEAIAPVNSPDELIYKLAIPHDYQLFGRALQFPLASHSYLVLATQFTSLAALVVGGGVAAKIVHVTVFLATLALIRRMAGDWTAVVVAWTPALMIVAGWAWAEWGLLGLLLLSMDAYERWLDSRGAVGVADGITTGAAAETPEVHASAGNLVVAVTALGAALACKYTAIPWALAFVILAVVRHRREARLLVRGAMVVALFGAFFFVRNMVWTGSPVAPLLLPNAPGVSNYRGGGVFGGWVDLVHGTDIFDAQVSDESLGILLPLAFVAGLFALGGRDRRWRDLALIGLIQMPILLTIAPGSRNMINGVVPLAIAGSVLIAEITRRNTARVAFAAVAGVALAGQLALVAYSLQSYDLVTYLSGAETASDYIARTRAFAAPYTWIARNTPPSARILLLGENRTFYLERQFLAASNLDGPRIAAWLASFPDENALAAELHRRGVTHVLIHTPWYRVGNAPLAVLEHEYVLQVAPATHRVLLRMLATHCRLRYRDREYVVYEVLR